jgi:guanosine-3',5'-bis(diphosphate) 3'-pyrophosphohydrolase
MTDPNEFLSSLKMDLYPDEVYTFTPKGKVVVVPADGTPVDFAYTMHTEVGHTCVGAKVNGRMVPLRTKLRNGDIVEIVTQNGHTPSRDWLTFVKSPAGAEQDQALAERDQRQRAIEIGASCWSARRASSRCRWPDRRPGLGARGRRIRRGDGDDLLATMGFGQALGAAGLNKLAPGIASPRCRRRETKPGGGEADVGCGEEAASDRVGLAAGGGAERSAGLPRAMLQPDSRRRDYRLRDARQGRGGACAELPECAESAV